MPHVPPPAQYRFTRDNAREFAARGNRAKAAARLRAKSALIEAIDARAAQLTTRDPLPDDYVSRRLARVRLQLDLIDERIHALASARRPDGQELNWLCQAQERLADQERTLSGRPLPGNLRPVAPRPSSRSTIVAPSLPAPSLSTPTLNSAEQPATPSSAASSTSNPPLPPDPEHP